MGRRKSRPWIHSDGRRFYITVPIFGWRIGRGFTLRKDRT